MRNTPSILHLAHLLSVEDADFLPFAYKTLLGREIDFKGASHYSARLAAGIDKLSILVDIRRSTEGKNLKHIFQNQHLDRLAKLDTIAGNLYRLYLRRALGLPRENYKSVGNFDWIHWSLSLQQNIDHDYPLVTMPSDPADTSATTDPAAIHDKGDMKSFFDGDYYLACYQDVKNAGIDPFAHYMTSGWRENRNPSPEFDTHFYKTTYLDQYEQARKNPLLHYVEVGSKTGHKPRPNDSITIQEKTSNTPKTAEKNIRVAIHIHLFYPEMVDIFAKYISIQHFNFDIIITTTNSADAQFIRNYLARTFGETKNVIIREVENRGRDIAPFIIGIADLHKNYDYICHLHSKRSPHAGFGTPWLEWILRSMFGNPATPLGCLAHMENNPDCAIIFPDNYFEIKAYASWGGNEARLKALAERWKINLHDLPPFANFPAGSMAWYRSEFLQDLIPTETSITDFEAEGSQLEGTFAHLLERALPLFASAKGWRITRYYLQPPPAVSKPFSLHAPTSPFDPTGHRWQRDTPAITRNRQTQLAPLHHYFNEKKIQINWIIPSFGIGAGGHMTIFRIVQLLESFGHYQTIWIQNADNYASPLDAKKVVTQNYRSIGENVHFRFLPDDVRQISGDVVIATDCWTAFPASCVTNVKGRFYFIQDYEPYFHPMGENYLVAESTYNLGFAALCAGKWLLEKAKTHGMWAREWDLAADEEYYYPLTKPNNSGVRRKRRLVFYCRSYTPRRAVALGLAAFKELAQRRNDFEVLLFGEPVSGRNCDFPATELGILSPEQLGDLYRAADVGVAFSSTNYSLIPLEMMACDLPVVELDCESTRAVFPEGAVIHAAATVNGVADALELILDDEEKRRATVMAGRAFVSSVSWNRSARLIENAIIDRLVENGSIKYQEKDLLAPAIIKARKASIIIPTYNGGRLFQRVLMEVANQKCDFHYDVLVIDSSSDDGTAEFVKRFGGRTRLVSIPTSEFQHGRTRNRAIGLTDGEIVAVITQDACPKNSEWLQRMVDGFSLGPEIACVIGRHEAYPEHNKLLAQDMLNMFDRLRDYGPVFSFENGLPSFIRPGSQDWRMLLHFYSDNNSALRRSVWEKIPYPNVEWGEDQVWCWEILKVGLAKAYINDAIVYHSHQFDRIATEKVGFSEGFMFAHHFGYDFSAETISKEQIESRRGDVRLRATRIGASTEEAEAYC